MKFLITALLLVTTETYAAGCRDGYHSVAMTEEIAVVSLGDANAHLQCNEAKCSISTTKEMVNGSESHNLLSMGVTDTLNTVWLGKVELKMYRQQFESLCSSVVRYTIGLDYEGIRFRELEDIQFID